MRKSKNEIDSLFRNTIEPSEMIPSGKVWKSIDKKLDQIQFKKFQKKYSRLLYFSIGLSSILAILIAFQVSQYYLNHSKRFSFIDIKNNAASDTLNGSGILIKQQKNGFIPSTNTRTKLKIIIKKDIILVNSIISSENKKSNFKPILAPQKGFIQKIELPVSTFVLTDSIAKDGIVKSKNKLFLESNESEINRIDSLTLTSSVIKTQNFDSIPFLLDNLSDQKKSKSISSGKKASMKNQLSLIGFFSPEFNSAKLFDNDNNDNKNEGDFEDSESPDFSYSSGFKIGSNISNKFTIYSGLSYSSVSYSIKPQIIYANKFNSGETGYLLKTSSGIAKFSAPLSTLPGDSIRLSSNSIQKLQFLSIPLLCQYQFTKNKLNYYAFAGVSSNFFISGTTEVNFENFKTEYSSKIEGLKRVYFSGIIGIGVHYSVAKKLSLLVEPTFKKAITSINKNTPVYSFPYSIGLSTGILLRF